MKRNRTKLMLAGPFLVWLFAFPLLASAATSANPVVLTDKNEAAGYKPGTSYTGEFVQSRLYYRNPRSAIWRRMSDSDNYREVVTCRPALGSLENVGHWQGHLKQDGSCGPQDEPSFFALGSRINYDVSLDRDVSSN